MDKSKIRQAIEWYRKKLSTDKPIKEKLGPIKFEYTFDDDSNRYCEKLIGKNIEVANHIVSRIDSRVCVANQLCSLDSFEKYLGINVDKETVFLREIMLCAEIIRAHINQIFFEIMPVYYKFSNVNDYIAENKKTYLIVQRLNALCNETIRVIGARTMHPSTLKLGGFTNFPDFNNWDRNIFFEKLLREWKAASEKAYEFAMLTQRFYFPAIEEKYEFVSLTKIDKYAFMGEGITKSDNKDIILYGAISRVNNNMKLLGRNADKLSRKMGLKNQMTNPFHQLYCMGVEIVHLSDRIVELMSKDNIEDFKIKTRNETSASAVIESSFGLIRHAYKIDDDKKIIQASILFPQRINAITLKPAVEKILNKETGDEGIKKAKFLLKTYYL